MRHDYYDVAKRLLVGCLVLVTFMAPNGSAFSPTCLNGPTTYFAQRYKERKCQQLLAASSDTNHGYSSISSSGEDDTRKHPAKSTCSSRHSLYLFSLPASNMLETYGSSTVTTSSTCTNAQSAVLVKRLWEWKDDVLGDGRDFFVPRPNTLLALNQVLRRQIVHATECVVLSNCARFDVILVVHEPIATATATATATDTATSSNTTNSTSYHDEDAQFQRVRHQLAQALIQQYTHYYKANQKQKGNLFSLTALLASSRVGDNPQRLWLDTPPLPWNDENAAAVVASGDDTTMTTTTSVSTLTNNLASLRGPDAIAHYLCRVATGLEPQGRRPQRAVVFRPFSSRDAHVMLQLKRTAEIANQQPRIKALLDTALQSGKAARDPTIVPAILPLKKYADSSSRYSLGNAPAKATEEAAKQAHELAIQPMVDKYIQKWAVFELSDDIQTFRRAVEAAVKEHLGIDLETSPIAKPLRTMMHPHVMRLREGKPVDLDQVLTDIRNFKVTF